MHTSQNSQFTLELEQEDDGRWIAEVGELAGVLVYGATKEEAVAKAEALALRVVADRLETETMQMVPSSIQFSFA